MKLLVKKQSLIVFIIFGLLFATTDGKRLRMKFFAHLFFNLLYVAMGAVNNTPV